MPIKVHLFKRNVSLRTQNIMFIRKKCDDNNICGVMKSCGFRIYDILMYVLLFQNEASARYRILILSDFFTFFHFNNNYKVCFVGIFFISRYDSS